MIQNASNTPLESPCSQLSNGVLLAFWIIRCVKCHQISWSASTGVSSICFVGGLYQVSKGQVRQWNINKFWSQIYAMHQQYSTVLQFCSLTQSEFQSGRNRTVFCVLVVKLTTTKHFGILGRTRSTKRNVRPHTNCMGGGERRNTESASYWNHA